MLNQLWYWRAWQLFSVRYGSYKPRVILKINFALVQNHKYSLTEIENMIPWERDIYISLLKQYIDEENLKAQQKNG